MNENAVPFTPGLLRRIFLGPLELRAGYRLLIFAAIFLDLLFPSNWLLKRSLPADLDEAVLYVLKELLTLLCLLLASLCMAKVEAGSSPSTASHGDLVS